MPATCVVAEVHDFVVRPAGVPPTVEAVAASLPIPSGPLMSFTGLSGWTRPQAAVG